MKIFIVFLLLMAFLGIMFSVSFAQQSQTAQKPNPEIETLKNRILVLESKLQTVENAEKIELLTKLTEANAKLANAEFGKFERELRNANDRWLRDWGLFFLAILAVVGVAFWYALKSLIASGIEKRLDGFKEALAQVDTLKNELQEAVGQVNILEGQVTILNREHAASVLERYGHYKPEHYPEQVKELEEQAILDVFSDETRHLRYRMKAAEVLAYKGSTKLVSPVLKCLNSYIDSDFAWDQDYSTQHLLCNLIYFIGQVRTTEIYETLHRFLEQLLSEKPEIKRFIITTITFSLVDANGELNKKDSVSLIRKAIPILNIYSEYKDPLIGLVKYFNKFQEYEGIKDILTNGLTNMMPEVETRCLELLQNHDAEFVEKWKAQKEIANTQNEESE